MKLFNLIFKPAQERFLRARIESACPDLKGLPFRELTNKYVQSLIDERIDENLTLSEDDLPWLAQAALTYTATQSVGYYRAQALLYETYYRNETDRHIQTAYNNLDLLKERNGFKQVAQEAMDLLESPLRPNISPN